MKIQELYKKKGENVLNNEELSEISNTLKIIAWRTMSDYLVSKKDIINIIKESDVKKPIWDLCNGKNCRKDIAIALKKDPTTIRDHLKPMFDEGIIFTKSKGNKKMLITIDEMVMSIFDSISW